MLYYIYKRLLITPLLFKILHNIYYYSNHIVYNLLIFKKFKDIINTNDKFKLKRTEIIKYEIKVMRNSIKGKLYLVKDNKEKINKKENKSNI